MAHILLPNQDKLFIKERDNTEEHFKVRQDEQQTQGNTISDNIEQPKQAQTNTISQERTNAHKPQNIQSILIFLLLLTIGMLWNRVQFLMYELKKIENDASSLLEGMNYL